MSFLATVIEIFLSSPGDVSAERSQILALSSEWNRLRSRETGCFISILTWEGMVAPELSDRPQGAVNRQIGNTYDVYLSVMWARIGTPTGVTSSGTVEEFDLALERAKRGENLRLAALFKKAPVDPTSIDPIQLQGINNFKKRISDEGLFYRDFSDESSLRSIINLLFEQIAKDKDVYSSDEQTSLLRNDITAGSGGNFESIDDQNLGFIEIGEEFEAKSEGLIEKLGEIGKREGVNTEIIGKANSEIDSIMRFGSPDRASIKKAIKKASDSMNDLARYLEANSYYIEEDTVSIARLIDNDLKVRLDFGYQGEKTDQYINNLKQFCENVRTAADNLESLIEATDSIPRMSVEIGKARNSLSINRGKLHSSLVSLVESTENSLAFFEKEVEKYKSQDE